MTRSTWSKSFAIKPMEDRTAVSTLAIMKAQVEGESMLTYISSASYDVARINSNVFFDKLGSKESKNIIYLKYATLNPDKILQTIRPFIDQPFPDSLVLIASQRNPVQL